MPHFSGRSNAGGSFWPETFRQQLIDQDPGSAEIIKPFLAGRDIKRYQRLNSQKHLIFFPKGFTNARRSGSNAWKWLKGQYPAIAAHLEPFQEKAKKRYDKDEYWWELRACDYYEEFEKPKIMLPDISLRGNFALDENGGKYCVNTAYMIANSERYLLGILNSALITFFYKNTASAYRGGYLRFIYQYLKTLPIPVINFDNPSDKANHYQMVALVDQMLALNHKLNRVRTAHERQLLNRQIQTVDSRINQQVCHLYGLNNDEIRLIQSAG